MVPGPGDLLGDVCCSCPVDIWALGCVFAEVLVAAPVYEAHSVVSLIFKVFSALGAPEPGGYLTALPLYSKNPPRFQAQFGGLPCDGVQGLCPELAGMLKVFFHAGPEAPLDRPARSSQPLLW